MPYDFILGSELIRKVAGHLRKNQGTISVVRDFGFDERGLNSLASDIENSSQPSIDRFLEIRADEALTQIGKIAIACELIPREHGANVTSRNLENHWYSYLFQHLAFDKSGVQSPVAFVTFNYDRSLEYFLFSAFKSSLGVDEATAQAILETIPIHHVYGSLGRFSATGGQGSRPYSTDLSGVRIAVDNLRIMYEGESDSALLSAAQQEIARSRRLCFLGFGYDRVNLERLSLGDFAGPRILGSACKLGDDEIRRARAAIGSLAGD